MRGAEPVVVTVDLAVPPERAFAAFTHGLAEWWPAATHSLSRHAGTRCRIEPAPGGALEERAPDGALHRWGTVESVEPGRRLRLSWHPGREADTAQSVEVRFEPLGRGTRATLTHGGWEALGEVAPILRREYAAGWQDVFGRIFAAYVHGVG
jgi:uncharacterized protein YndB with AHSA1/START domain